jgi:hypothetical protein
MILKKITIEFTDNPNDISNHGIGTYYYLPSGELLVRSYMKDGKSFNEAWLIAMHELIEQRLTEQRGIPEPVIDDFDRMLDERGEDADFGGDHPDSPYRKEHRFSENIERLLAHELSIDWFEYYNNYQI